MEEATVIEALRTALAEGRLADARTGCSTILREGSVSPEALILVADVAVRSGQSAQAIEILRSVLRHDPFNSEAREAIFRGFTAAGQFEEAGKCCKLALKLNHQSALWQARFAHCLLQTQNVEEAIATSELAIRQEPHSGLAHETLAMALHLIGSSDRAEAAYEKAIELNPHNLNLRTRFAKLLLSVGKREQAISICHETLILDDRTVEARLLLAEALFALGRTEQAEQEYALAAKIDPQVLVQVGFRLQISGRFEAAQKSFIAAIEATPEEGAAYYGLVRGRVQTSADLPLIETMVGLASLPHLPAPNRIYLHYALGKSYEDLENFELAMIHFDEGNALVRSFRRLSFDINQVVRHNDSRIRTFNRAFFQSLAPYASSSRKPVLVVGMIRSGTTLLEQMLSRHSQIGAAGEQTFWGDRQEEFNRRISSGKVDNEFLLGISDKYLELLGRMDSTAERVIDKMPLNFFLLGQIHATFPKGKIIHCRRDPVDTALSIYTTFFENSPPFAHDRTNIAAYIREYRRLIEHWRSVLPAEAFLEIDYEELVGDPRRSLDLVLNFLDLAFDEKCIQFCDNPRPVHTPSVWQVRQPLYARSVRRSKKFEPWLGKLNTAAD